MKVIDSVVRSFVLGHGVGVRWLRQELRALRVGIPLTDRCVAEFVRAADCACVAQGAKVGTNYVERLKAELHARARFIHKWTGSDEDFVAEGASVQADVSIARNFSLPRRWKVSEPQVVAYARLRPSYWQWTDTPDPGAVRQG